ncbi:MAG: alkaline phosphatase family protein [Planctomycetes bacterium]|nr:alkaline phosphatase family protein [Planctomycetota bacterium]
MMTPPPCHLRRAAFRAALTAVALAALVAVQGCREASGNPPASDAPAPAAVATSPSPASIDHVLLISVDGLRPEAALPPLDELHPGLKRLTQGAWTAQARCDPDISITLPNHVGMITGRLVAGELGHGWTSNSDPPSLKFGGTLHAKQGRYIASAFDVAHDAGVRTAMIAGKWKFALFEQSYGEDAGGKDGVAPDDGKDKIDCFVFAPDPMEEVRQQLAFLHGACERGKRSFSFLHLPTPDFYGHGSGWDLADGSPYREALQRIDHAIAALLAGIEESPHLRGHVAIVLTSDHAGGVPFASHTDPEAPVNYTILFMIWNGANLPRGDLYAMNPSSRHRPAPTERFAPGQAPPIRNADAGNACLMLLGLPGIPGSTANTTQDLRIDSK